MSWTLADILDVEAQIAADRQQLADNGGDRSAQEARDRRLAADLSDGDPQKVLRHWLAGLRRDGAPLPGRTIAYRWRLALAIGAVVMFLAGAAAAGAVFAYDGSEPINLIRIISLLVVVPGVLLGISLLAWLPLITRRLSPLGGPLPGLLGQILGRWGLRPDDRPGLLGGLLRRRDGNHLYAPAARWLSVSLIQLWGLSCFFGVLVGASWRALGSDLAFAWHSTLIDAEAMLTITDFLSLPWAWLMPSAVPDAELIALSRYVLLEGRFAPAVDGDRAVDAAALHRWWPFVVWTIVCWSWLPRLLTWSWSQWRLRHHLGQLILDHDDHRQVVARLQATETGFTATAPVTDGARAEPPAPITGDWPTACHLLTWIDTRVTAACEAVLAASTIHSRHLLGASADLGAEGQALAAIGAQPAPVVIGIDASEPPVADILQCLADARAAGNQPVIVALAGTETDREIWRTTELGAGVSMKELP